MNCFFSFNVHISDVFFAVVNVYVSIVNEDNSNRKGNVINKNRRAARAAHIVLTNKKRAARAARIFLILLLVLENSKRENTLFVWDFIENVSIP